MKVEDVKQRIASAIDEVVAGALLQGINIVVPDGIQIIFSLGEAKVLAWEGVFGGQMRTWSDIREVEACKLKTYIRSNFAYQEIAEYLYSLTVQLFKRLKRKIPGEFIDLADDISGDIQNVALNFAVGKPSMILSDMREIYLHGGWPCGWHGDYPKGRIVAFDPKPT